MNKPNYTTPPAQPAPVQEPVATISITQRGSTRTIDNHFSDCVRDWPDGEYKLVLAAPPAAQPAPTVQEPVAAALFREALAFGLAYGPEIPAHQWDEMREEKVAQLVARLAAPPAAQPEPVAQREAIKELADQYARECVEFSRAIAEGAHSMSPIAVKSGDTRLELHTAIDAITIQPAVQLTISTPPAAQPAPVPLTDEMVTAAARALNKRQAEACGVDKNDHWKFYGDDIKEDAKAALEAAHGITKGQP